MFMFMFMFMLSHVIPYAKHPLEIPPFNRFSASTTSTDFCLKCSLTPLSNSHYTTDLYSL
jgi:hypothetical protein